MDPQALLCRLGFPPEVLDDEQLLEWVSESGDTLEGLSPTMDRRAVCEAMLELDPQLTIDLLFLAAQIGTPELLETCLCLLECGAPAAPLQSDGGTLLMALTARADAGPALNALAKALVQHGCPIDAVSSVGRFALDLAFASCKLDLAVTLLESGASLQPPGAAQQQVWLHNLVGQASWTKCPPAVATDGELLARMARLLVTRGADPNELHEGYAPLHMLALCMVAVGFKLETHMVLLEELLALGADASATDLLGRTAARILVRMLDEQAALLDEAALQHCCAAIAALTRAGCDVNVIPHGGLTTSALHQAVYLAVKACGLHPEAGPGWVALVGTLLEAGADPGLVALEDGWDRTALRTLVDLLYLDVLTNVMDVPAAMVDLAIMLAEAERQKYGGACVRYSIEMLVRWFGKLNMFVYEPSGQRCMQLAPGQLQLTQLLLRHCCPPPPWPSNLAALLGAVNLGDNTSPSSSLIGVAMNMGDISLLEMLLRVMPPSERSYLVFNTARLALAHACCLMMTNRLCREPPPEQGQLEERHAFHALQFWRQAEVFARLGQPVSDDPSSLLSVLSRGPEWAGDLIRFGIAAALGAWHPSHHSAFPDAFKAATRALLLINSCRGFAAEQLCSRRQEQEFRNSRRRQLGVRLPVEVLEQILCYAASPPICWMPQLFPFMTAEEQQRMEQQEWHMDSSRTAAAAD